MRDATRHFRPLTAATLLLAFAALMTIGCSQSESQPEPTATTDTEQPSDSFTERLTSKPDVDADREADFVFVSKADVRTLDPQKMSWLHDIRTAGLLYETLLVYKLPQIELEGAAAESWSVSDDGLVYTFNLRKDAKWSDGEPVTAHDFIYAWRRALMPDYAADYSQLFYCIEGAEAFLKWRAAQLDNELKPDGSNAVALRDAAHKHFAATVGIKAVDDHTLVVTLAQPTAYFPELCAFATFAPNPSKNLASYTSVSKTSGLEQIEIGYFTKPEMAVFNGPYTLDRYRTGRDLLTVQNPHYWNKAGMKNTSVLQRIIESEQNMLLAYDNGEVDWLPDIATSSNVASDLVAENRSDVHTNTWAGTYFYSYNCQPKLQDGSANPLVDPRVRRALSMAVDRNKIVNNVTKMRQPIARSFVPPGAVIGYEPPVESGMTYDLEGAKALLKSAGYATKDSPGGKPLNGLSILYAKGFGHEKIAQVIRLDWERNLGVDVALDATEQQQFATRLKSQGYTIGRASWIGDYPDPTTFLDKYHTEGGNNDAKFSNAKYDALLAEAKQIVDPKARMAKLREAETILLTEQPILPIYHYITLNVYDPEKVIGIHPNTWNFRRLELVEVKR